MKRFIIEQSEKEFYTSHSGLGRPNQLIFLTDFWPIYMGAIRNIKNSFP